MANVRTQAEIDRLQPMFTVNNQYINIHKREEAQDN